jgi:HEAT repeat protein
VDNAEKIEPILKAKLKDAQPRVRMAAIDVLTEVRPKADYVKEQVLATALEAKDIVERDVNIRLCTRLPESDQVLKLLYECSFDKEAQIREAAAQALGTLGPKALPLADKMLEKLQAGNADSLPAMLAVLKYSKDNWDAIEESLVKLLGSENVRTRGLCLDLLASHPLKDDTIRKMAELLEASDKQVRMLAIRSLHPFAQKKFVQEAVASRREKETDKGVKQLLDLFMSEVAQVEAKKP